MPNKASEQLLGGHAVLCVGYDDVKKVINYYLEEKKIPIVIEAKTISNGKLC